MTASNFPDPGIVILLGAGASVDADLPSVRELTHTFPAKVSQDAPLAGAYAWVLESLEESAGALGRGDVDIELVLSAVRELQLRKSHVLSAIRSFARLEGRPREALCSSQRTRNSARRTHSSRMRDGEGAR